MEVKPGKILKEYTKSETREVKEKWKKIFCKNAKGFGLNQYLWHIFSGNGYPSVEGEAAEREYESHIAPKYIVMSNGSENALLTDEKPNNLNYEDVFVFPENYSWTMAFTHEEGWLGPYFAKHKDYGSLEKENAKYREKLHQIEIAKSKGWL